MAGDHSTGVIMNFSKLRRLLAAIVAIILAIPLIAAQAADPDTSAAELRLLRSTNERLTRENEALKAEVAALKKKLGEGDPTTRPAALSCGLRTPTITTSPGPTRLSIMSASIASSPAGGSSSARQTFA